MRFNGIEEYKQFGVLVLIMKGGLLFQKRALEIPQGGEICFPGGGVEPQDQTFGDTALRETQEEINLNPKDIGTLYPLDPVIAPFGAIIYPFLGKTDRTLGDCTPNPQEVSELFTVPISYFLNTSPETYQIMIQAFAVENENTGDHSKEKILLPAQELNLPEQYHKNFGKHYSNIYCYRYNDHLIWGLTAKIIKNLIDRRAYYPLDQILQESHSV